MRHIEFKGSKQEFIKVLERCLQLYLDHKICPQEFSLSMSNPDSESVLFLHKWIPVVVRDWAVEAFSLFLDTRKDAFLDLHTVLFKSESLQCLYLTDCTLCCFDTKILFVNLKELCLSNVCITEKTLEKIICRCPLITLDLISCKVFRAIRVDKRARFLKRFISYDNEEALILDIDVPSLEKIVVFTRSNWYHDMNTYFSLLKSLSLFGVWLSRESFCFCSRNFPCLESLSLKCCIGFEEFELSSRSIRKLEITVRQMLNRAAIDVPSIVMFKYEGCAPESFSFTTTSEKWKSNITLLPDYVGAETSPRLDKVGQLLRAIRRSEISLDIGKLNLSSHSVSLFMDNLFCICRPISVKRYLVVGPESRLVSHLRHNEATKLMCKILGMEKAEFESGRITKGFHWRQDLENVMFETSDECGEKWHPVLERSLSEFWEALLAKDSKCAEHCIRFRFTWRE